MNNWTTGRHILITGASSGIGATLAKHLNGRAGRLTLVSRNTGDRLNQLALSLRAERPPNGIATEVEAVALNVNDWEATAALAHRIYRQDGRQVDALIHCAGGSHYIGLFDEMSRQDIDRILDTNCRSTLYWLRCLLPFMKENRLEPGETKRAHVVVLSSRSAERALPMLSVYAVSKAAVDQALAAARSEYARHNVAFTGVNPGSIRTAFTDDWPADARDAHNVESMTTIEAIEPIIGALDARYAVNRISYQSLAQWQGEPGVI